MADLLDARGVPITAGDVAIWGFAVGRSVAMAEGVIVAEEEGYPYPAQTKTGRIKVRVTRRSYSSGEKPVIDLAADRLIVLKSVTDTLGLEEYALPPSPLPTQDQEVRARALRVIEVYRADIDAAPDVEAMAYARERIAHYQKRLRALDG